MRFYQNIKCAAATIINDVMLRTCLQNDVRTYTRYRYSYKVHVKSDRAVSVLRLFARVSASN